jgi:hypothetical protein
MQDFRAATTLAHPAVVVVRWLDPARAPGLASRVAQAFA